MRLGSKLLSSFRFVQFKSLGTMMLQAQLVSDSTKTLQNFSHNPTAISFHSALTSLYQRLEHSPNEITRLPSLIYFMGKVPKENSRPYYEAFLCKHPRSNSPVIKQLYFHQLGKYISSYQANEIEFHVYYFVVEVCYTLVLGDKLYLTYDSEGEEEPEFIKEIFEEFTNRYSQMLYLFDLQSKISVAKICKSMKIFNLELLDHLKILVQRDHRHMTMSQVLIVLAYLQDAKALPYEFFYAHKEQWLSMINKYSGNLQRRSEGAVLRLFQILAKGNLTYTGRLIQQIIKLLKNNINQLEVVSLVRVLYYYSKTRFEDKELVQKIIELLTDQISNVKMRSLKYMLIALGNLKYKEVTFLKKVGKNEYFLQCLQLAASEMSGNSEYFSELVMVIRNQ